jgi:hypothetical protein
MLLEEQEILRAQVLRVGNPEDRDALRKLDKLITQLLAQLGFTPAARARLGLAEVKTASRMEALRRSREKSA